LPLYLDIAFKVSSVIGTPKGFMILLSFLFSSLFFEVNYLLCSNKCFYVSTFIVQVRGLFANIYNSKD
jgi:hypothetical protein